jgi:hypothetical protein
MRVSTTYPWGTVQQELTRNFLILILDAIPGTQSVCFLLLHGYVFVFLITVLEGYMGGIPQWFWWRSMGGFLLSVWYLLYVIWCNAFIFFRDGSNNFERHNGPEPRSAPTLILFPDGSITEYLHRPYPEVCRYTITFILIIVLFQNRPVEAHHVVDFTTADWPLCTVECWGHERTWICSQSEGILTIINISLSAFVLQYEKRLTMTPMSR